MINNFVLTVVGKDNPGIVAAVTSALFDAGCNLGEASMLQLGNNFTMMLQVESSDDQSALANALDLVVNELGLTLHIDSAEPVSHHHCIPDVRITVHGADRAGIVAQVTKAAAEAGLNIIDLTSDIGGTEDAPFYLLHIEGIAAKGYELIEKALEPLQTQGVKVDVRAIDTLIG